MKSREIKDELWEELIKQIRTDLAGGDCSAIYELLSFLPDDTLIGYLDEDAYVKQAAPVAMQPLAVPSINIHQQ